MTRGLFISFEGIDGAGKSTHIARVAELFRQAGRAVVLTREPGGTPVSEKLRELVLHDPMDPLTEALTVRTQRRARSRPIGAHAFRSRIQLKATRGCRSSEADVLAARRS